MKNEGITPSITERAKQQSSRPSPAMGLSPYLRVFAFIRGLLNFAGAQPNALHRKRFFLRKSLSICGQPGLAANEREARE
ncbi:hypothetical protein [Salinisphaera sp. S4-8]|uniref:hypothetical protein n=1 Tax=Salinisphaera sp. S4-8 TaxID=633357 RepID=UPI003342DED2